MWYHTPFMSKPFTGFLPLVLLEQCLSALSLADCPALPSALRINCLSLNGLLSYFGELSGATVIGRVSLCVRSARHELRRPSVVCVFFNKHFSSIHSSLL